MSPELYLDEMYGYEVDMWAFGVIFYFITGSPVSFEYAEKGRFNYSGGMLISLPLFVIVFA